MMSVIWGLFLVGLVLPWTLIVFVVSFLEYSLFLLSAFFVVAPK